MSLFVKAEALGICSLSARLPSGLLLTDPQTRADFLICAAEQTFAVCLEGSSGFAAFELQGSNEAWHGCFVSGVQLQADVTSRFTNARRDVRPGDMVIDNARLCIAAKPVQLGHLPRLIVWGEAVDVGPSNVQGGFTRWRVVRIQNEQIVVLREVNSEEQDESR